MEYKKKYRYPGINSFETSDSAIFFGREDDTQKLTDLIEIEKTVLFYSKSGLGKSSLIKAAVIPKLLQREFKHFYIRLGLYHKNSRSPVQSIFRETVIKKREDIPATFLNKFINRSNSLWYAFKAMQIDRFPIEKPVILIFDQFEEIANYEKKHLIEFKQQLSELLYTHVPKSYLDALKDEDLLDKPLTNAELDMLFIPLRIRVVFVIRSDQMSVMNEFADYLPNILKVFYELKPLSRAQALEAIVRPARQNGEFITPPFIYQEDAIDKIQAALASRNNNDIDTAQLQILLQHIEKDIVEKELASNITVEELGDLNKVYENYYFNSLQQLTKNREEARLLLEDKLIVEGRRISFDKTLCLQMVSNDTLDELIDTRLLRKEPNTTGEYNYELSHDSLIAPILDAREKRRQIEKEKQATIEKEAQKKYYEVQLKEQHEKRRQQAARIRFIFVAFIISIGLLIWVFIERNNVINERNNVIIERNNVTQLLNKLANSKIEKLNSEIAKQEIILKEFQLAQKRSEDNEISSDDEGAKKYHNQQARKYETKKDSVQKIISILHDRLNVLNNQLNK